MSTPYKPRTLYLMQNFVCGGCRVKNQLHAKNGQALFLSLLVATLATPRRARACGSGLGSQWPGGMLTGIERLNSAPPTSSESPVAGYQLCQALIHNLCRHSKMWVKVFPCPLHFARINRKRTHVYICMFATAHAHVCVCIYTYVSLQLWQKRTVFFICIYTYIYIYICIYIYIYRTRSRSLSLSRFRF